MAWTIPNAADSIEYPVGSGKRPQSEWDKVDADMWALGLGGDGVSSGCAVTQRGAGANQSVDVAVGGVVIGGATAVVSAGNVAATAAHATLPRFDLVVANNSGTKSIVAGTAASTPVFPAIPANSVVLAAVFRRPNDNVIENAEIVDKRITVKVPGTMEGYDIQVFTADGTWTKPSGCQSVKVVLIGAGGGGGGGSRSAATNASGGGGGGGGGIAIFDDLPAEMLAATESVVVGVGGPGGAGASGSDGPGSNGTAGEDTTFGSLPFATSKGGTAGLGNGGAGTSNPQTQNVFQRVHETSSGNTDGGIRGGDGSAGSGTGTASDATDYDVLSTVARAAPGGGGGGGKSSSSSGAGGAGGSGYSNAGGGGGGSGGGTGNPGTNTSPSSTYGIGGGGGGGGGNHVGNGGAGGAGGDYGAGGGGGGGSNATGGTGGAGGDGFALVVSTLA